MVRHVAPGSSSKATALRQTVRQQFKLHDREEDPTKIETLKSNAIRALSNYMLYQSAQKDTHLQKAMNNTTNINNNNNNDRSKKDENDNDERRR